MTLSKSMQEIAAHAVGEATYARFFDGMIIKRVDEGSYDVAMGDQIVTLPVYGNGVFDYGQHVYIISPHNSKQLDRMFILGNGGPKPEETDDHKTLMQLMQEVSGKLDAGVVVQEKGQSTKNIMSQKAVTDIVESLHFDGVKGVILGSTQLELSPQSNMVTIPIATKDKVGVVRSTEKMDGISVDVNGNMTINTLDVMRLRQQDEDDLILDGGNAWTWE